MNASHKTDRGRWRPVILSDCQLDMFVLVGHIIQLCDVDVLFGVRLEMRLPLRIASTVGNTPEWSVSARYVPKAVGSEMFLAGTGLKAGPGKKKKPRVSLRDNHPKKTCN